MSPINIWPCGASKDKALSTKGMTVWSIAAADGEHFAPSKSTFMVNYRVEDLAALLQALRDEGYLDLHETFIDGGFAPAKKGGACVGKTKRGKGSKIMAIADRQGLPIAVHVESATPHEVTLVRATLATRFVRPLPTRLRHTEGPEDIERKTVARCDATDGGGRSSDSLPGSRIFGGSLSATSVTPRTFLRCYTSPAASFSCEVYEMASNLFHLRKYDL